MQRLNEQPRQDLSPDQVSNILKSDSLTIKSGCERLGLDLSFKEDVSDDLEDGGVTRTLRADIHGTCGLTLLRDYDWANSLFRPYMYTWNSNRPELVAKWYLGAYYMSSPTKQAGDPTRVVNGYDRLYLLEREIGDTYEVASGTSYLTAMKQVITDSGLTGAIIDSAYATKTLPKAMVWPLIPKESGANTRPATWRSVFNDLAAAVGYNDIWADQAGIFRSEPFVLPSARPIEYTFDSDEVRTIVGFQRVLEYDLFKIPNKWKFIQQNRPEGSAAPTEGNGIYTVTNATGDVTSIDQRGGLVWTRTVRLDAADQTALVAQGDQIVAKDKNVLRTYKVKTGPFPAAGHMDIFRFKDLDLGTQGRVMATRWELNLSGSDMSWTWEEA